MCLYFILGFKFTNVEPCNSSEFLQQNNDIIYKNWVNAGITSIKYIFNLMNCSFIQREELERIYNINISVMKYNQLISAIQKKNGRHFYRHQCSLIFVQVIKIHINDSVIYT